MSKSKEELNKVKEDVEAVDEKLQELTPEEIAQISGGKFLPSAVPGLKRTVGPEPAVVESHVYREPHIRIK